MPCPGTRALCWQHLVLLWEHCAACMKLSQDTPKQLKPPEIKMEADKLSQLLVGGHLHSTGPQEMGLT